MRFRAKDGQSARRFVFDRTPPPETAHAQPEVHIPTAAELDTPYGRYYGKAHSREELLKRRQTDI